ncbi:MAG TPA: hypothetical protein VIJ61_05920, partial [Thermoanaerobaculia bacterium]
MPTDTAEMKDTAQTGAATATQGPEHHQTQAAAGSPQAGAAASTPTTGSRATGTPAASGTSTSSTAAASATTGSPRATSGGASSQDLTRRGGSHLNPFSLLEAPFGMMRSMMDQMDRLFNDFTGSSLGRSRPSSLATTPSATGLGQGL